MKKYITIFIIFLFITYSINPVSAVSYVDLERTALGESEGVTLPLVGWDYRKSHVIQNATDSGSNYQVRIITHFGSGSDSGEEVYLNSNSQVDFDDVRFTDNDETTVLDYWLEEKFDSDNATFWVEIADSLSSSNMTIYIYYGNVGTSSLSDGVDTFIVFDDFEDALQGDWTEETATVDFDNAEQFWGGSQSMKLTTQAKASIPITSGDNIAIRSRLRHTSIATVYPTFHGDSSHTTYVKIDADDNIFYYSGGWSDTGFDALANTWYLFEWRDFDWSGHTFDMMFDGSKIVNDVGMHTAVYENKGWVEAGVSAVFWEDNYLVRKFVDPEPSHGIWGAEESGGGGFPENIIIVGLEPSYIVRLYDDSLVTNATANSEGIANLTLSEEYRSSAFEGTFRVYDVNASFLYSKWLEDIHGGDNFTIISTIDYTLTIGLLIGFGLIICMLVIAKRKR